MIKGVAMVPLEDVQRVIDQLKRGRMKLEHINGKPYTRKKVNSTPNSNNI